MAEKDSTEKVLEDYNDVFADIINGLIFKGRQEVKPDDLSASGVFSQYKADDSKLHQQERDVVKIWKKPHIQLAVCGIENQTKVEKYMPLRVAGYEGASYRSQYLKLKPGKSSDKEVKPVPVVTLVLYFGTKGHWDQPKTIRGLVDIPSGMEDYVNDCRIHVFEIAWLTDEEIDRFHSDFRIVANFFVQKRKNADYVPKDKTEIKHVDALLKLLSVMTGDN